ncbi:WbqC family protein [Mesonia sp. K7]|uniref:WbqC family protein n=1 Tax=Mesonia sp. K7 TaxID=2218606 RepID=UPI000DA6E28D|nr:WbqC family protein [Mesonia sp. K7]PZD78283.1 hypothetical protein DNG35_06175 [Mesonia sp. K7]
MEIVLQPAYFGSIAQWVAFAKAAKVHLEVFDNYQKQTYRNRQYIYGANGKLLLNIPIKHSKNNKRQKTNEVKIDNSFHWQTVHWKSLQTAYRTSPFFEFYEDEIAPLFQEKYKLLIDFNLACQEVVLEALQLEKKMEHTATYQIEVSKPLVDGRTLINAKTKHNFDFESYHQVFADKHGFIENLSILDLLFNEGPNAINYLTSQAFDAIEFK